MPILPKSRTIRLDLTGLTNKMERSKILGTTERPVKGCAVLKRNETTAKSDNDG